MQLLIVDANDWMEHGAWALMHNTDYNN